MTSATAAAPSAPIRGVAGADLTRIALVALGAAAVWLRIWEPLPRLSVIGAATTVIGGYPIFAQALASIRERKMTMELSMTIALLAALAIGEFFTALVIILFVLVAETLEELTVERGRRAVRDLVDLLPAAVMVRREETVREVPASEVSPGETVLVSPGARIPVDGVVVAGRSFVDQSAITGESMPVEKTPGVGVFAGTINQSGALEVRGDRLGRDTSYGKIIEAVERAERARAPIQKTADQLAGYLVYFAIGCAALTFLLTRDVRSTISVIIVAGACGIAAGTPLAILGAIGQAARKGAIVKGGRYLEALAKVDTVVLDKTGTLTFGRPAVQQVVPAVGVAAEQVIEAAAITERRSEHPLGRAIREHATNLSMVVAASDDFHYTVGRGITVRSGDHEIVVGNPTHLAKNGIPLDGRRGPGGSGSAEVLVARDGRYLGAICVADILRPDAARAVQALKGMGIRTVLLTGDARAVAATVGHDLGIDELHSELLPVEKVERVRTLVADGRTVAMVGDGINDAPALVEAQVGVAMGSGTDVARESADVVLLGDDLLKFVETVRLARRMRRIIWQNFEGTLAVDALGVGLAAFGLISPLLAAFIHVASELAFILNSTRLLPHPASQS